MDLLGPLIACVVALILILIGIVRFFVTDLPGSDWKRSALFVGGGLFIVLLLAGFFWSEQQHMHHDAEGDYDDRQPNQ